MPAPFTRLPKHLDSAWLYAEYVERERSAQDIAVECGVSAVAVSKSLKRHGIEARPFQGRRRPGDPKPDQRRTRERIEFHLPMPLGKDAIPDDAYRAPPLTPLTPVGGDFLFLRVDVGWADPRSRWIFVAAPDADFTQLAAVILSVCELDFETTPCSFIVPEDGKPPRRSRVPWRPGPQDVIVPVVEQGDEQYDERNLFGSPDTPLSVALGRGWTCWLHWDYLRDVIFTVRVFDAVEDVEFPPQEGEPFRLLAAPTFLPSLRKGPPPSIDPIDTAARVTRAARSKQEMAT